MQIFSRKKIFQKIENLVACHNLTLRKYYNRLLVEKWPLYLEDF